MVDTIDLEQFRAKRDGGPWPATPERKPKAKRPPRHRPGDWFLKGPIPGPWLSLAAKLPGKALHVGLALWCAAGMVKGNRLKLTSDQLRPFGVGYDAGHRGLAALERAGLVTVDRHRGRCPVVTICEAGR